MINVGIIGYGKMGKIRHQVVSKYKDTNVILICDPTMIDTEIEFKIAELMLRKFS